MKKNVNRVSVSVIPLFTYPDGTPITCQVDNFPADNPAYKKVDGFRCNDVSLLDRLSFDQSFDSDLAKIVASRVKEFKNDESSNMSEQQLLHTLRPSWVQTASEVKNWEEQVYQYVSTLSTEQAAVVTDAVKDSVSDKKFGDDVKEASE